MPKIRTLAITLGDSQYDKYPMRANLCSIRVEFNELNICKFKYLCYCRKQENEKEDVKQQKHLYYERTLITILNDPNDEAYKEIFNIKTLPIYPKKVKCSITK